MILCLCISQCLEEDRYDTREPTWRCPPVEPSFDDSKMDLSDLASVADVGRHSDDSFPTSDNDICWYVSCHLCSNTHFFLLDLYLG